MIADPRSGNYCSECGEPIAVYPDGTPFRACACYGLPAVPTRPDEHQERLLPPATDDELRAEWRAFATTNEGSMVRVTVERDGVDFDYQGQVWGLIEPHLHVVGGNALNDERECPRRWCLVGVAGPV